ncbi:MAG: hypothetical protein JWN56_2245 [Sphingobacteriales bacterium]|nr:hypothetical protein [Sphingobacteriales bacterium]
MNNCSIFVSSSDAYSDLWPVFFDLFKKYWPEYKGEIVLNTETLSYSHLDLNIRCTKVGKLGSFGKVLRAGLDSSTSENVLLVMIDYIFMGKVNHQKVEEYYQFFCENKLDSLCLVHQDYPNVTSATHPDLISVIPPAPHIMFSYQIAFWTKVMLREMALPHENPWMSEWYGSQRAEKIKIKLVCPKSEIRYPIPYDSRGCLHQGKWLDNAVQFLHSIDYSINFDRRGYYVDGYNTFTFRVRLKLKIWSTGLKGSYLDLLLRKKIV